MMYQIDGKLYLPDNEGNVRSIPDLPLWFWMVCIYAWLLTPIFLPLYAFFRYYKQDTMIYHFDRNGKMSTFFVFSNEEERSAYKRQALNISVISGIIWLIILAALSVYFKIFS